ncbi:MAG: flagellar export protein FliJ [Deltaproteobacteria bacterium]|nr:flagellar export protein FliJ [Deltaproteobacteria bacterium]
MYQFTLEPLLNHRKSVEDNLQKELGVCKTCLAEENRKLRTYKKEKNRVLGEMQQKQQEGITVSENLLYFDFIDRLSRDLDKQKQRLSEVKKKYNRKHNELIEAVKKRRILEKLKEKQLDEYNQRLEKSERNFINEVAISQFNRKSR